MWCNRQNKYMWISTLSPLEKKKVRKTVIGCVGD